MTDGGATGFRSIGLQPRCMLQSGLTVRPMPTFLPITSVSRSAASLFAAWFGAAAISSRLPALLFRVAAASRCRAAAFMRKRRQKTFGAQFPDALDIIVRSLRAGHPVPVAIAMVAREMPDPIGTEFGIVADEITYGADLETAMRNLYFRVGQDDLPLFVTAVAIQSSTGGNWARSSRTCRR